VQTAVRAPASFVPKILILARPHFYAVAPLNHQPHLFVVIKPIRYYQIVFESGRARGGLMENHFVKVSDTKALEELAVRSKERPVVIFKHSLTCPISAAAYEQMAEFDGEVALVEVQRARELSGEIESRLGVAHESPQVIVLRNGQVAWNASHFKITADAVAEAVRNADGSKQEQ